MKPIPVAIALALALLITVWRSVTPPHQARLPLRPPQRQAGAPALPSAPPAASAIFPRAGSLAMIGADGADGPSHIAIVEAVSATSLTIIEGDSRTGAMARRSASGTDLADAERQLRIVGYYQP